MKVFAMSDIHGCLAEFEESLNYIKDELNNNDTMLILLGDYIHGGDEGREVLDKVISLQKFYGEDKIVCLLGNHEEWVLQGYSSVDEQNPNYTEDDSDYDDDMYIDWFESLPRFHVIENNIFTHAGINESAGEMWEFETYEDTFTNKFPADIGEIPDFSMKIIAGHIYTSEITNDPSFNDIYEDKNHIYIDGDVLSSGQIPILMVDTDENKYYRVTANDKYPLIPYLELD